MLPQKIQHLRNELLSLNTTVSKPAAELSNECIAEFGRREREWGENFVDVYQRKNVTPYIHAVINHVGEFMHADPRIDHTLYSTRSGEKE